MSHTAVMRTSIITYLSRSRARNAKSKHFMNRISVQFCLVVSIFVVDTPCWCQEHTFEFWFTRKWTCEAVTGRLLSVIAVNLRGKKICVIVYFLSIFWEYHDTNKYSQVLVNKKNGGKKTTGLKEKHITREKAMSRLKGSKQSILGNTEDHKH